MRITFVGFGLLASSVAAAIKQAKLPTVVRAVSSPATLVRAKELGLADECFGYDDIKDWVNGSDMILLCAPILHILKTIENLSQMDLSALPAEKQILVSDIGSTKVEICKAGSKLPKPFGLLCRLNAFGHCCEAKELGHLNRRSHNAVVVHSCGLADDAHIELHHVEGEVIE